jgi:hypothetical protein
MVCVAPLVEFVECGADDSAIAAFELRQLHWHGQRKFLADVAQIELNLILRIGAVAQGSLGGCHHLVVDRDEICEIGVSEIRIDRADEIVALICQEHAKRRKVRREQRHDHGRDIKLARNRTDV